MDLDRAIERDRLEERGAVPDIHEPAGIGEVDDEGLVRPGEGDLPRDGDDVVAEFDEEPPEHLRVLEADSPGTTRLPVRQERPGVDGHDRAGTRLVATQQRGRVLEGNTLHVGADEPTQAIQPGRFFLDSDQGKVAFDPRALGHGAISASGSAVPASPRPGPCTQWRSHSASETRQTPPKVRKIGRIASATRATSPGSQTVRT